MPQFPSIAYSFAGVKDTLSNTLLLGHRTNSQTASATTLTAELIGVPRDYALILTNVSIFGGAGVAQKITAILLTGFSRMGIQFVIADIRPLLADTEDATLNWQGEVTILGRGAELVSLRAECFFDGGANANSQNFDLAFYLVPKGNMAPF